jgi:hypothetical protein
MSNAVGHVFRLRRKLPWEQPRQFSRDIFMFGLGWFCALVTATLFWGVLGTILAAIMTLWRTRWRDRCSDPDCAHVLEPTIEVCPGCQRPIVEQA